MATNYRIDVLSVAGVKLAEITDFHWLKYKKKVNAPGLLQFELNGDHRALTSFIQNGQIIVYRQNTDMGIDWYADFYALYQAERRKTTKAAIFVATCPGQMNMLNWRINAWYASTANRTSFTSVAAETIMKNLVKYNCTSSATTGNGRIRNGTITGISIATDQTRGNTLTWNNAYANVLEDLQKLALVAGGDFDLVKTGAQAWSFEFYPGQLGTDRTATITFSLENANMAEPEYVKDNIEAKTVAIAAGAGQDSARDIAIRTSSAYSSNFDIETFVDARNVAKGDTSGLNAKGDAALQDAVTEESFTFKVLQAPSYFYGKHYFLGDKVKASYKGISVTKKLTGVDIAYERKDALESIDVELTTIPF